MKSLNGRGFNRVVGKTIAIVETGACNAVELHFTDGTAVQVYAESSGPYGIPVVEVSNEHVEPMIKDPLPNFNLILQTTNTCPYAYALNILDDNNEVVAFVPVNTKVAEALRAAGINTGS